MKVMILDEITVKPGLAAAYRTAYASRYVPGAQRRGMTLAGAWQTPPGQDFVELPVTPVSYTHLTLPTNREV